MACIEARNGRFLHLQEGGWWSELSPDKVHEKITASIYDCHRRLSVKGPAQSTKNETHVFLPNNERQKVVRGDEDLNCECRFF
jgi:hypothetical protein